MLYIYIVISIGIAWHSVDDYIANLSGKRAIVHYFSAVGLAPSFSGVRNNLHSTPVIKQINYMTQPSSIQYFCTPLFCNKKNVRFQTNLCLDRSNRYPHQYFSHSQQSDQRKTLVMVYLVIGSSYGMIPFVFFFLITPSYSNLIYLRTHKHLEKKTIYRKLVKLRGPKWKVFLQKYGIICVLYN